MKVYLLWKYAYCSIIVNAIVLKPGLENLKLIQLYWVKVNYNDNSKMINVFRIQYKASVCWEGYQTCIGIRKWRATSFYFILQPNYVQCNLPQLPVAVAWLPHDVPLPLHRCGSPAVSLGNGTRQPCLTPDAMIQNSHVIQVRADSRSALSQ